MKRMWLALGIVICLVIICGIMFKIYTRPLITSDEAFATAKQQLTFMGYTPPYSGLAMGTSLGWYNHGRLLGLEPVYFTTLSFQPKPGAQMVNAEVVEDARSGVIISVFQYNTPPGNPLF